MITVAIGKRIGNNEEYMTAIEKYKHAKAC